MICLSSVCIPEYLAMMLNFAAGAEVTAGFVIGLFFNFFWRQIRNVDKGRSSSTSDENVSFIGDDDDDSEEDDGDDNKGINPVLSGSSTEPHKMVFCVRTDLKMQKGKIAAQVGHATLGAYKACARIRPEALRAWENDAQPKVALQIPSHEEAMRLHGAAKDLGLTTYIVYDAGRTQVAAVRTFQTFSFLFALTPPHLFPPNRQ